MHSYKYLSFLFLLSFFAVYFLFLFFVVVQINSNEKNGILIILFYFFVLYFIRIMTIKFENRIKDSKRQEPHVDLQESRSRKYYFYFYIFLNSVQQLSVDFYLSLILIFFSLLFFVYFFYYFLSPDTLWVLLLIAHSFWTFLNLEAILWIRKSHRKTKIYLFKIKRTKIQFIVVVLSQN